MIFNHIDSLSTDDCAGASLSIDPTNPVHGLYAAAAVTAGATVVGCVGVTTIAAPGLVIVPGTAAAAMAAGAAYLNDRAARKLSDNSDNPAPAPVGA